MCVSPHEMTSAELEQEIAALREWARTDKYGKENSAHYARRADLLEEILKERAEEGTY